MGHLLVAMPKQPLPEAIREELLARLRIRCDPGRVEVAQPEPATHLAAIERVAAEMDQMAGPDRRLQQAHTATDCGRDARVKELGGRDAPFAGGKS